MIAPAGLSLLLLLLGGGPHAAVEPGEPSFSNADLPLRWLEIEGAPYWVEGPPLRYSLEHGLHLVEIPPRDSVRVKLGAGTLLRIHSPDWLLTPAHLEAWNSDGSGLQKPARLVPSRQGDIVARSDPARTSLLELVRRADAPGPLRVALFVSEVMHPAPTDGLGTVVSFPRGAAPVARDGVCGLCEPADTFWQTVAVADARSAAVVEGPARLLLRTRLVLPPGESGRLQSYRIRVTVDGTSREVLLDTDPDTSGMFRVGPDHRVLCSERSVHLDLESGHHEVSVEAPSGVYWRLLAGSAHDYLLETPPPVCPPRLRFPTLEWIPWPRLREEPDGDAPPDAIPGASPTVLLDTLRGDAGWSRDAGLQAGMFARGITLPLVTAPGERAAALSAWRRLSFFRTLSPEHSRTADLLLSGAFGSRHLRDPRADVSEIHVTRSLIDSLLDNYSVATFQKAPSGEAHALLFHLPERLCPSVLRIAVAHPSLSAPRLVVRLGDGKPIELRVLPGPELPAEHYHPLSLETGEAAALLAEAAESPVAAVLGRADPGLRRLDVGTTELYLPSAVKQVSLWAKGGGVPPLVALQVLAERRFALTEREYLDELHDSPEHGFESAVGTRSFTESFHRWRRGAGAPEVAADPLLRHRLPFFRRLRRQFDRLEEGTVPGIRPAVPPGKAALQAAGEAKSRASALESEAEWLPALEAWGDVLENGDAELRGLARRRRIEMLENLGERYLAERQLLGLWRHGEDSDLRRYAFERLLELHEVPGAEDDLLEILGVEALESGEPALLRRFVERLAAEGDHLLSLDVAWSLPPAERPVESCLRSAWSLGWWETFDNVAQRLQSSQARRYWRGLRLLSLRRYSEAVRELERAGGRGRSLAACVREALEIRDALQHPDPRRRLAAILRWEEWQASGPGPWRWIEDPASVVAHGGAELCRSISRNTFETGYRTRSGRPVVLDVQGPARLRVEIRPIHPEGSDCLMDSWLTIRSRGFELPVALTGNLPARGLELTNASGESPGTRVTRFLEVGPGRHRLEVRSRGPDVLVRCLFREREPTARLLSRLTPWGVAVVAAGGTGLKAAPAGLFASRVVLHSLSAEGADGLPAGVPVGPVGDDPRRTPPALPRDIAPVPGARLAIRLGDPAGVARHLSGLRALVAAGKAVSGEEKLLARAWLRDLQEEPVEPLERMPPALMEASLLDAGRLEEIVKLPLRGDDTALRRRMECLLWIAEAGRDFSRSARVRGEELFQFFPRRAGIHALHSRLVRQTKWERLEGLRDSAGSRRVPLDGWHPENPGLRVRKAIARSFRENERLLAGTGSLGFFARSDEPATLRLELELDPVEYLPPRPVTVLREVDGAEPTAVTLSPKEPSSTWTVSLAPGEHSIRLRIRDPVVNQFVRVRLAEGTPETLRPGESAEVAGKGDDEDDDALALRRKYAVATTERPVRLAVEGPASLRIDELRGERTSSHYRHLPAGVHELTLRPSGGSEGALFRLYRRVPDPGKESILPWRPGETLRPVPPARFQLPDGELRLFETPSMVHLEDALPPGRQEDGTLSVTTSLNRRRVFEEDESGPDEHDEYLELRVAYRCWLPLGRAHFESAVLSRFHADAGPSVGIEEDVHWTPDWLPFTLRLRGTGYLQWPEGPALLPEGPTEWSATLKGTASRFCRLGLNAYHLPSLSVFGRLLSLDDADDYPRDVLDLDVFTPYKEDHKAGLVISETFGYRPWLDTEWWAGASLTSNETLNPARPDHVSGRVGWRQFFRGWRLDAGYRVTRFFDDGDRSDGSTRQAVSAELFKDFWVTPRSRLEIGFEYRHDFPDNENAGFISITWHFSNGRGLRDFWPRRADFRNLREAYMPEEHNNFIRGEGHE